ncbi:MAG: hypothetical protein ACJA1F_002038 [Paracoccaceae bacterium]|jgi:hypothetical protein
MHKPSHHKGKCGTSLTRRANDSNRTRFRIRAEHILGAYANETVGTLVRTIGTVRAKVKSGIKTLAYNMRRLTPVSSLIRSR